jgi:hypothetical protein
MFWNKKPKSSITLEDENWVTSAYEWFGETFKIDLEKQEIYLPTPEFLGFEYSGCEEDAIKVVDLIAEKLNVGEVTINVYFFEEFQPMEFTDEGVYSNYEGEADIVDGSYEEVIDGIYEVGIERTLLKNPMKLIATVAHEVAHIKLLGEKRLDENDEHLTDLSASLFGFIVFLANSSINKMDTWSGNTHSGWNIGGGSGYIHPKVYPFLIAYWAIKKNEKNPAWFSFLDKEILKDVKKSIKYLELN